MFPVVAEVYRWVDEDGVTHFSARKPSEGQAEIVAPKVIAPSDDGTAEKFESQSEAFDKRREAADKAVAESEKSAQEQALKKSNCDGAKKRVETLSRPRVNTIAEDGTRTRMPEEWRQDELKKAQALMQEWCN